MVCSVWGGEKRNGTVHYREYKCSSDCFCYVFTQQLTI